MGRGWEKRKYVPNTSPNTPHQQFYSRIRVIRL